MGAQAKKIPSKSGIGVFGVSLNSPKHPKRWEMVRRAAKPAPEAIHRDRGMRRHHGRNAVPNPIPASMYKPATKGAGESKPIKIFTRLFGNSEEGPKVVTTPTMMTTPRANRPPTKWGGKAGSAVKRG